jgi:hypothetical protein
MYHLAEHNLGFIAHPKTASSATQRVLIELGATQSGTHHSVEDSLCQRILDAGGLIASVVRNPFDLLVSWYFHYLQRTKLPPFEQWLPEQLSNPNQYIRRGLFYGLHQTNRILRYETLQDDFDRVLTEVGLEPVTIGRFNVSHKREGRHYREMYTFELIHLVQHHFGHVIQELGYSY